MKDIKITESELRVLESIWEIGDKCKLTEIQGVLTSGKNWKSTTVCTLLSRLEKKSVIKKEKQKSYVYSALISRDEYVEAEVNRTSNLLKGNIKNMFIALCSSNNLSNEDIKEIDEFWQKKKEHLLK